MTSLTQVMYQTRMAIKGTLITVFGLILLWNIYKILYYQWRRINPPPPPPPTVYFGVLPALKWPQNGELEKIANHNLVFRISTIRQRQLKNQIGYVFLYLKNRANIWGPAELSQTARQMGFPIKEGRLKEEPTWIRFYNQDKTSSLDINEVNGYFRVRTKNYGRLHLQQSAFIATSEVTEFLENWLEESEYWTKDLEVGSFGFYRFLNGKLIRVETVSDAQIVEVRYKRRPVAKRPVIFTDDKPVVSFWVGKSDDQLRVVKGDFQYRPIYLQKPATYPLVSPSISWEYLKNGKGLVIKTPSNQEVVIDKAELAFYDAPSPYKYMVPIYIFSSSKDNFKAISSALPEKWLPLD